MRNMKSVLHRKEAIRGYIQAADLLPDTLWQAAFSIPEDLYEKAEELGLKKIVLKPSAVKTSKDRKVLWMDENACGSYCQDCIRYHKGKCEKTGKEVGALWQKKCFRGRNSPPQ